MNAKALLDQYKPESLFSLADQTAMVIGVGGLGQEAAIGLSAAGARLVVADIDFGRAETVANRIKQAGGSANAYTVDVIRKESVHRFGRQRQPGFGAYPVSGHCFRNNSSRPARGIR